jgi:predicted AlkP superfamily pyrophosphatase or phosphodiesterase
VKPLLIVFIDALKPESIECMPFLNSFPVKRRIRTELGYSPTCYASMLTGVRPNKHLQWFTWRYSPSTSPFKWINRFHLRNLPDNIFSRYLLYKITELFSRGIVPLGVPGLAWWAMTFKNWPYFDTVVKTSWSQINYNEKFPTLFKILHAASIPYEIVGIDGIKGVEKYKFNRVVPLVYFFIGDIDSLSHLHGQDSVKTKEYLMKIDDMLRIKYEMLCDKAGASQFIVFSDHGHIKINSKINPQDFFKAHGDSLNNYIYLIDANFARFWPRSETEKNKLLGILSQMADCGFILTDKHKNKYSVDMPDTRYGEIIFYLATPHIFTQGLSFAGKKIESKAVSSHGYLPDHSDSDGIFITNKEICNHSYIELVDVMPSVLNMLGLNPTNTVDGKILWK